MVIATIVTVLGLIFGYIVVSRATKANVSLTGWETILKDIIPISGIILALASPVITAAFNPVLDYSVSVDPTIGAMQVTIHNYGFASAKGIEVYFNLAGIYFNKFTSMPFINGTISMSSDKLSIGNGLFYIPALPPGSETLISASTNSTLSSNDKATVYVRSETSKGIHRVLPLTQAYVTYAIAIIFNVFFIIFKKWKLEDWDIYALVGGNILASVVIFLLLFYGVCEANGNCLSYGINK